MKIAYLANIRFPSERAHSVQIAHMCQALAEEGLTVDLFASDRSKGGATESSFGFVPKFHIKFINNRFFFPRVRFSFYLAEWLFARQFLRQHYGVDTYDIIYSRHEWILWYLSHFASTKNLVYESHEAKSTYPVRLLIAKGVKIIAISEGIYEKYLEIGVNPKSMLVAHDAIDKSFFEGVAKQSDIREKLGLPQEALIAMYIGGFDTWKGVETFFASATLAPDILFVAIGGTGKQVAHYQAIYPKVRFIGPRPYQELRDNQQAADILVVPNSGKGALSSIYTSPLKLFAHLTSGVPMLVSDVPSLVVVTGRELVGTFIADDAEDLAAKLKDMLEKYDHAHAQAQLLKQTSFQYTWQNRTKKILTHIIQQDARTEDNP